MSFGWSDSECRGYDVRVFDETEGIEHDQLYTTGVDQLGPHEVSLALVEEVPEFSELPESLCAAAPADLFDYIAPGHDAYAPLPDNDIYHGLIHVHGNKVGGFPSWVQNPEWPTITTGVKTQFAGQIDYCVGHGSAWGSGGYSFLFVARDQNGSFVGDLVIQTS